MTTIAALRKVLDPAYARAAGAVRRMAITLTAKTLWQLGGFRMPDGSTETFTAEPFTGIGFYARPPDGSKPEAIALMVGGAKTPVIVAVRDEQTRAAVAGSIAAGETMMFSPGAVVYAKASTVEISTPGGLVEKMVKGQTYRAAEDTLFTALNTFVIALGAFAVVINAYALAIKPVADPSSVGTPALTTGVGVMTTAATAMATAIATFDAAAATYLSNVGKVE